MLLTNFDEVFFGGVQCVTSCLGRGLRCQMLLLIYIYICMITVFLYNVFYLHFISTNL